MFSRSTIYDIKECLKKKEQVLMANTKLIIKPSAAEVFMEV